MFHKLDLTPPKGYLDSEGRAWTSRGDYDEERWNNPPQIEIAPHEVIQGVQLLLGGNRSRR